MADRIKGITIALSADTSGLTNALENVNKNIKNTKSDLRDVERLLKLDPTNVELLEQKQRLLSQSVEDTKTKLDLLNEAQQKLTDEMEQSNEVTEEQKRQYENLQREIISTKDYLEKDTAALEENEKAMQRAGSRADEFAGKLDNIANKANKVADKTRALSGAAGAALGGIAALAIKGAKSADELNTIAKQTGLSTDALQEMQYAADLIDVPFDTFVGSANKMKTALRTNEDAFTSLGVATRDASGQLLDSDTIYWNAVNALGNIANETERDLAAQELFGRSSSELAGLIDDGGAAFQQYAQEAENAGLILSGDTLNSMNAVNDQLDQLKAKMTAELFAAAAPALEVLAPVLDTIIGYLGKIFEFIGQLDSDQVKIIMIVLGIVAAISPVASLIGGIMSAISLLTPVVSTLFTVLSANPILLIIGLVAALAIAIYTHWEEIKPILDKFKETFLAVFEKVKDAFVAFKDKVVEIFKAVIERNVESFEKIKDGFLKFKDTIVGIIEAIKEGIKKPINTIIGFINTLIDGINYVLDNPIASAIGGIFGTGTPQIGKIPMLANGGTLSSGSAIVGEAGPEVLTMANGAATVTPIVNVDTSGIERAISAMNGSSGAPINLALNIDGKAFARATYNAQAYEASRRGGRLVTVG